MSFDDADNSLNERIYMDYTASTPLRESVQESMEPYWQNIFANPMAAHADGRAAKEAVEEARETIADVLGCAPKDIIFTSGGTEANSLSIFGFLKWVRRQEVDISDLHLITSAIEHSSVLNVFRDLRTEGAEVDFVGVDSEGVLDISAFKAALKENTALVSVMQVNSEIGTIQPIQKISHTIRSVRDKNTVVDLFPDEVDQNIRDIFPLLHTDATQAPLFCNIQVESLGVDMMSLDAQKIYGPKGVGVLYKQNDVPISPLFLGGGQEHGLRPGTENVPLIVGMAEALNIAQENRDAFSEHISNLQDRFLSRLRDELSEAHLNGGTDQRVPNNINISFSDMDHEFLAVQLDERGISVATKSACLEGGVEASHVIKTLPERNTTSALRISFGENNTKEEVDYVIEQLKDLT